MNWDTTKLTAIFGGTFDPVHEGHIQLAQRVHHLGHVEQVIFVPAARSPHKLNMSVTDGHHRYAMLEAATHGHPSFGVSDYELVRGGISYTIETAAYFKSLFGDRMRLLIGADSLAELHLWHRARELVSRYSLIIYTRPGITLPSRNELEQRFGDDANKLLGHIIHDAEFNVSSTDIRRQLMMRKGQPDMVSPAVYNYIVDHGLYTA